MSLQEDSGGVSPVGRSARRLVVGITGASGVVLGIRLLQALQPLEVESHLVLSPAARVTISQETNYPVSEVLALANVAYNHADIGAAIASGSFPTQGMVIIPCSIKTLSAVANAYADDLITRAADVTLKEGRPLVLVVREAPLHRGHLRLMSLAAEAGAVIFPPVPAFYAHPQNLDEIVANIVGRVLARLGIDNEGYTRWQGMSR
jgi:4-hydroxy-3-polyprenylbenzoate decarboxylase